MKTPRAVRHVTEKLCNHLEKIPVINIELEVNGRCCQQAALCKVYFGISGCRAEQAFW